jgi:hypothetical protein
MPEVRTITTPRSSAAQSPVVPHAATGLDHVVAPASTTTSRPSRTGKGVAGHSSEPRKAAGTSDAESMPGLTRTDAQRHAARANTMALDLTYWPLSRQTAGPAAEPAWAAAC